MLTLPAILARRTRAGLTLNERPVRIVCRFADLRSSDGEQIAIEWSVHLGCVDTPADRAMLHEHLLPGENDALDSNRASRWLADELRGPLASLVAASNAVVLLDGSRDVDLGAKLDAQTKRIGFAAGLRVAPPFALRVTSPSLRRAQDVARAKAELDAVVAGDAQRIAAVDELRDALASGHDRPRAIRGATRVDARDLLRAVSIADGAWSAPTPMLWIVAGDQLIGVDPTRPDLAARPIVIEGIGPIRSVRAATPDVEGLDAVAIGGKGGVTLVSVRGLDRDPGSVRRTRHVADGDEYGFNAVVSLHASIVATHRSLGLVRWPSRGPDAEPIRIDFGPGGGRTIVAVSDSLAIALSGDGRLFRINIEGPPTPFDVGASPITDLLSLGTGRLAIADGERAVSIVDVDGTSLAQTRVSSPVAGLAGVDLYGVPRVLVSHDDGAVTLVDVETGATTPLGDGRWPAKAIRSRPGFAALLSVDRMRVGLLDLARPDAPIVELHVHAQLGRRVADVCFA